MSAERKPFGQLAKKNILLEEKLADICSLWAEIRPTLCDDCGAPDIERMDKLTGYNKG